MLARTPMQVQSWLIGLEIPGVDPWQNCRAENDPRGIRLGGHIYGAVVWANLPISE